MPEVLKPGKFDEGAVPANWTAWWRQWHADAMPADGRFRGEADGEWIAPSMVPGGKVRELQSRLKQLGFLPHAEPDGIFDYRTQSAARLFQDYVRSGEGHDDIGAPDGAVGDKTRSHLDRWERDGVRPYWANVSGAVPTAEFRYWLNALELFKAVNGEAPIAPIVELAEAYTGDSDTHKIEDWRFDAGDIHLIGIRRQEWKSTQERQNDDLFVLLVNGLAFKFYGSTDPSAKMADRADEPFIVRGQHQYRFGWHKQSDRQRVYRALRPAGPGVLVCRDFQRDDALSDAALAGGLAPNNTINIHWSGSGTSNWSAGCQVIAGTRYVDGQGRKVDCTAFAARGYAELPAKTRGAWNVLVDLLTVFAPKPWLRDGSLVYYTLIYEKDLELEVEPGRSLSVAALADLSESRGNANLRQSVSVAALTERLIRNIA